MDLKTTHAVQPLMQTGLAQALDFAGQGGYKLTPKTAMDVAQLLQWAEAENLPVAFSEADAKLLAKPFWLDGFALKQVRQQGVEDFIIQVECGMTYRELLAVIAPCKQVFPLSYPPDLTLGEILAEERPALETGLRGYPRDYVLKTELASPDGQLTISGADVVKNVTGYDLAKLYIGGQHSFGVLTSVTLKLIAMPAYRTPWLYRLDTLNTACAFSALLLNSQLPLSVCELFQRDEQWHLLIEMTGEQRVLAEAEEALHRLNGPQPDLLDTRSGQALIFELQRQPENQTIIELSFPLSRWQGFITQLSKQPSLGKIRFQIRPAAGLVYLYASQFQFAALRYLKQQAQSHQGIMQVIQIASTDVTTVSEAAATFAEFNLPEEPALRHLLRNLKKSYDPKGILFTPRLPLIKETQSPTL